jgi:hypothetical protein
MPLKYSNTTVSLDLLDVFSYFRAYLVYWGRGRRITKLTRYIYRWCCATHIGQTLRSVQNDYQQQKMVFILANREAKVWRTA